MFACLLILILAYHQTSLSFFHAWTAENSLQSHGLLLLPLSGYLLAREWYSHRQSLTVHFRPLLLIGLSILSVTWLMSEIAQVQVVSQILLILILCVTVFALFGIKKSLSLVFPILLLLSATSVWSVLSQPLQEPTAILVNQLLHLTGYTSFQESYFITIPEGIFEVGDTCSGLRYQISAITLALIYAFFSRYSLWFSVIYLLLASTIAFISNSIRIYIVVLSGHYTNMTHSLLDDHIWLGWVVFAICYAAFMFVTVMVEKRAMAEAISEELHHHGEPLQDGSYSKSLLISSTLLLCATVGPIYSAVAERSEQQSVGEFLLNLDGLGLKSLETAESWNPTWVGADYELRNTYRIHGQDINLYTAYYGYQEQGKEAVNDLNRAYNSDLWKLNHQLTREILFPNRGNAAILEEEISDSKGTVRVVWSWYYIGSYRASSKLASKLYGILAGLMGRTDAAVVVISTVIEGDGIAEREAMKSFVTQTISEIEHQYSMQ